jgi:hypothetical protein
MDPRRRFWRIGLAVVGGLIVIVVLAAVNLYADVRRIGCQSSAQLLGPASSEGYSVSGAGEPGACFVSFTSVEARDIRISRVVCAEDRTFASCQGLQRQLSSGWSDFFGTQCTSLAFISKADCSCTQTGEGCQVADWPVEVVP